MGYDMPERPEFLESALQGVAYWMGYRRAYYRSYPIPEAAIVNRGLQSHSNETVGPSGAEARSHVPAFGSQL